MTLKDAVEMLIGDGNAERAITADLMKFTFNIKAGRVLIRILQTINSYDLYFMGQPCGIHYEFNYELAEGV